MSTQATDIRVSQSEHHLPYVRQALQCLSCRHDEARDPTHTQTIVSQKLSGFESCPRCDQKSWLAVGYLYYIAPRSRHALHPESDLRATEAPTSTSRVDRRDSQPICTPAGEHLRTAYSRYERVMTKFCLRRAGITDPERFIPALRKVSCRNPQVLQVHELSNKVDSLSEKLAKQGQNNTTSLDGPLPEDESQIIYGYVSAMKDTPSRENLAEKMRTLQMKESTGLENVRDPLLTASLDPWRFCPSELAMTGTQEEARMSLLEMLSNRTGSMQSL